MKIQFDKKTIESALQKTIKAVSARSPLPILSYVLIKTLKDGKVSFSTTDLEFGIECRVPADIIEEGATCVPAKIITDLTGQIRADKIILEQEPDTPLLLTAGKSKYHINTRTMEEFPIIPSPDEETHISLPQEVLKDIIKNIIISIASQDEQRAVLTGAYMNFSEKGIIAVSTDSRRLTKVFEPLENPPEKEFSVIIPQRSLKELMNLLSVSAEPVSVVFSQGQIFFSFDSTFVFSRIIDGKFPNYEAVLPKSSEVKMVVEKSKLQTAVKRALIMALDKETPDLLKVEIFQEGMRLMSNSVDVGDAYEEVPFQERTGDDMEIAFNGRYILDVLGVIDDDYVNILLNSQVRPVMIQSPSREEYVYIVMPVRIKKGDEEE